MAPVDLDAEKKSRVFLVYDDAMLAHAHIPHLQKKHPEKPSRITTIHDLLRELGLLERCDCESVKPRAATDEEILLVHTEEHLAEVRQITADVAKAPLNRELREPDGPGGIYYSPESLRAALLAAGCVIQMCDQILQLHEHETAAAQAPTSKGGARSPVPESGGSAAGAAPNGSPIASGARGVSASNAKAEARMPPSALALVRPPGHHAGYDDTPGHRAEGFCFFNSVACAARAAIASRRAERVLVLDYDVHHGNGTEKLFWEARDVLYMSIHRYGRNFYPETGAMEDVGEGEGTGFTVNMPWLQTGCGDADYLAACHLLLLPIARAFDPQLVLVSAGFDAADGDVQGGMRVTPHGFAQITAAFGALNRPLALALEGGYNQGVTARCVAEVTRALLGDVPAVPALEAAVANCSVCAHAEVQIRAAVALQREYWAVLRTDEHTALVEQYFERAKRNAGAQRASQRVQARGPATAPAAAASRGARAGVAAVPTAAVPTAAVPTAAPVSEGKKGEGGAAAQNGCGGGKRQRTVATADGVVAS